MACSRLANKRGFYHQRLVRTADAWRWAIAFINSVVLFISVAEGKDENLPHL
jgi:hypothetical protein